MAPHLSSSLVARAPSPDDNDNNTLKPVTIVGIVVACLAVVIVITWVTIRFIRKRAAKQREQDRGASFMTVKGVIKEGEQGDGMAELPSSGGLAVKGNLFSRDQLSSPSVILPAKGALRPNASKDEILQHYTEEGKLPRPFAPFMTGGGGGNAPITPENNRSSRASFLSVARDSFMSMGSSSHRFSVASAATTASSVGSGPMGKRKVRQLFNPVLPDELVFSLGEYVTVVNSYDDGWCIVGRDGFGGTVELGAAPAWCFVKPSPGLRAERPMRTTSLGVTVDIDVGGGPRHEVISWSNF